jgi:hypothetical protein
MEQSTISTNANSLELHYCFDDASHNMDAIVQNKCEFEILAIIKNLATTFEVDIVIETEPLVNGGLRRFFKIINKTEGKTAGITTTILVALITGIFINPITTSIGKLGEKLVEKIFEDREKGNLDKELEREQIENLKIDTKLKKQKLYENTVIIKRRSNFYEELENYPKVEKIGVQIKMEQKNVSEEFFVSRSQFKEFILANNEVEPTTIDNATIEIISPVLKKGNYKWRGIYNDEVVNFNMKSTEFKTLVQTGKIEFKNGSSINCVLELEKELNVEGKEIIISYNIVRVNEYFENDKPVETPEGKHHRQIQEADKQQLKLFGCE